MRYRPRSAVMWLAGINVVAFLLQVMIPTVTNTFMLISADLASRPYILVTHMFMHGGVAHLLFNIYALVLFGGLLEQRLGTRRFVWLYFVSGIVAGFGASFFYPAALGASGAVMGALAALIVVMPNLRVLFFFAIPMPFWMAGVIWALLDVMGVFFPSGVGNIAHLIGMAVGFGYAFYLRNQYKSQSRRFSKKTHLSDSDINDYLKKGRF